MDRLADIGSQLSQLTVYDIKSYYNQAKNMVLNVSEMEAKVREATNDEPCQQFNEIMPCIYSRFVEKEARQWREIYKALQLLEYVIKHGSERVVDDARSHLSTIKMLRNFHYIDEKGKDQGINVRNRANEIASLLVDLDKIRAERRKAKTNRTKYTGIGNDPMSGSRYGGFGSDSPYESSRYSGSGYGGGGGGGGSSSGFRDDNGRRGFEEYDAGDYEETRSPQRSSVTSPVSPKPTTSSRAPVTSAVETKPKEKAVAVDDLLGDWGESTTTTIPSTTTTAAAAKPTNVILDGGDDFDDFQSAPVSPPPTSTFTSAPIVPTMQSLSSPSIAPVPAQGAKPNLFDLLDRSTPAATPTMPGLMSRSSIPQQAAPTQGWQQPSIMQQAQQPARPNYFGTGIPPVATPTATTPMSPNTRSTFSPGTTTIGGVRGGHGATKSSSNFDDLWSLGLNASGKAPASTAAPLGGGKSIKDLEKEKAQAGIWGVATQSNPSQPSMGSGFGSFSSSSNAGGGGDDLLL
ncbi:hypothetical protein Clacol_009794 [Clathrus columnatus]|uniref:ENTH domain-containing protein n=1 Tax=Clathrus columnatus TaxID=1419009 RepID=A0AAV5AT47_9AGAM|nr:hypothetical protein Clacol_009794 [Clathrus columnatus]